MSILFSVMMGQVRAGMTVLHRQEPKRLSEWADDNFYLSSESSYVEGRWETERFQRGIMDCMSNDEIEVLDVQKSARVGYSQMARAAMGYFAEHKKRNQLVFLPSDAPAAKFMKQQVETMIRDVPVLKALSPWYGKKHSDNTMDVKTFSNGRVLHCRGGAAAKNYRELSVDVVIYDELDGFLPDVEQEGSPLILGDKRNEGSVFPKSIRGTTPKLEKTSLIKQAAETADIRMRFHVPCPGCGDLQALEFGGSKSAYGLKWDGDRPETAHYVCRHNGCISRYAEMQIAQKDPRARWQSDDGIWLDDDCYFRDPTGAVIETPRHVAMHIWTAYSPWATWTKIVREWLAAQGDITLLRTFVNTTLGEWWTDKGVRANENELLERAYDFGVEGTDLPEGVALLTCGVDTQPDRLEAQVLGHAAGDQTFVIHRTVFRGDPNQPDVWAALDAYLMRVYTRADGIQIRIARTCVDAMGANTKAVYAYCRARFEAGVFAIQGRAGEGRPVIGNPTDLKNEGVKLYPVGTMTVKDLIFGRLKIFDPGPGYIHFRKSFAEGDGYCDADYFNQLTAEELKLKLVGGATTRIYEKITSSRRNEALDTMQYAFAAFASLNIRVEEIVIGNMRQERRVRGELATT